MVIEDLDSDEIERNFKQNYVDPVSGKTHFRSHRETFDCSVLQTPANYFHRDGASDCGTSAVSLGSEWSAYGVRSLQPYGSLGAAVIGNLLPVLRADHVHLTLTSDPRPIRT